MKLCPNCHRTYRNQSNYCQFCPDRANPPKSFRLVHFETTLEKIAKNHCAYLPFAVNEIKKALRRDTQYESGDPVYDEMIRHDIFHIIMDQVAEAFEISATGTMLAIPFKTKEELMAEQPSDKPIIQESANATTN
jgi:hypothetical protein